MRTFVSVGVASVSAFGVSLAHVAAEPQPAAVPDTDGMGSFKAGADGGYINLHANALGDLPGLGEILNGTVELGPVLTEVDSEGLDLGADVYSHAHSALAQVEGLGVGPLDIYTTEQQALPQMDEPAESPGLDADLGNLGSVRGFHGLSKANWDDEFLAPSVSGELAWVDDVVADVELLNLSDMLGGGILPLPLPDLVSGNLLQAQGGQIDTVAGTEVKPDGSLAAYSEIAGEFAAVDLFGGVDNGGVSIGIVPGSGEDNVARIRAYADGEPGGAVIDGGEPGTEPDIPLLALFVPCDLGIFPEIGTEGDCGVELDLGVAETIQLPSEDNPIVELSVGGAEIIDQEVAADGTSAWFNFGGVSVDFTIQVPSPIPGVPDTPLVNAGGYIMSFPDVYVEVPEGGIYPDDEADVDADAEADVDADAEADVDADAEADVDADAEADVDADAEADVDADAGVGADADADADADGEGLPDTGAGTGLLVMLGALLLALGGGALYAVNRRRVAAQQ